MKNRYEVQGKTTVIFLQEINGITLQTKISTKNLKKALKFPNTWYAIKSPHKDLWYVVGNLTVRGKKSKVWLHRYLLNVKGKGIDVDHWNNDTLDNTSLNLRVLTHSQNLQNKTLYKNNKTGIPGVSFNKKYQKFRGKVVVQGVTILDHLFDDFGQAKDEVLKLRALYMPYSLKPDQLKALNRQEQKALLTV